MSTINNITYVCDGCGKKSVSDSFLFAKLTYTMTINGQNPDPASKRQRDYCKECAHTVQSFLDPNGVIGAK